MSGDIGNEHPERNAAAEIAISAKRNFMSKMLSINIKPELW